MPEAVKICPDFSKMKKPEKIPECQKVSYKRRYYSGLAGKILLEQSMKRKSKNTIIWDVIDWIFYKWWLITKVSENVDGVTVEFDWIHSKRVLFFIDRWEHNIDIKELLKLKWREVWIFRKEGKEGKNWNIISINGIVIRNNIQKF